MAAGNTYEAIATQTLGSDTATVTFSSIPSTYTDLVLVIVGALAGANWVPTLRFNSDTGSNYSTTLLEGSGSAAISERLSNVTEIFPGYSDGAWGTTLGSNMCTWQIQNYSNSTTYKTVLCRNNTNDSTSSYKGTVATVGLWRNTAAITSLSVRVNGGPTDIKSGSTFSLYGIRAA
jgi:hypothetical protein